MEIIGNIYDNPELIAKLVLKTPDGLVAADRRVRGLGKSCNDNLAVFYAHLNIITWFGVQRSKLIIQCYFEFLTFVVFSLVFIDTFFPLDLLTP